MTGSNRRLLIAGLLVGAALLLAVIAACRGATPSPAPPPAATSTPVVTPAPTPTPKPTPAPTPTPAPALPVGMKPGERYHDIHTTKLGLQCTLCHTGKVDTYRDPLAQVFNLADRRACLSCHKEGGVQPFYGEDWEKARVTR